MLLTKPDNNHTGDAVAPVVALAKVSSYRVTELEGAIRETLSHLGGLGRYVWRGQHVLLKPNLLSAREPDRAVTTHPAVVQVFIKLVREVGAVPVVGDSPAGAHKGVARVWKKTEMHDVCRAERVELINFEAAGSNRIQGSTGEIVLTRALEAVDLVINLAKLKTHSLTVLTGCVKNVFGLVPGFVKAEAHKRFPKAKGFSRHLLDVYAHVRPTLSFADAVIALEGEGPGSGEPRATGFVAAGIDAVAVDTVLAAAVRVDGARIPTNALAERLGLGVSRFQDVSIRGEAFQDVLVDGFSLPSTWRTQLVPEWLAKLVGRHLWIRPTENEELCTRCGICMDSCPVTAISWKKSTGSGNLEFDYEKCLSCLCCHEVCTSSAIELQRSWLARRI
jgi:uncharacterized protein (DUF362 family)/Pyruvate/2-oxoacid:ferredoxin oxidoreductase delta subunit